MLFLCYCWISIAVTYDGVSGQKIKDPDFKVHHIPGGYTGLCQPINVGYNHPFKCRLWQSWEMWMLREGLVNGVVQSPTQAEVVQWIVMTQVEMTMKIVKYSWLYSHTIGLKWRNDILKLIL